MTSTAMAQARCDATFPEKLPPISPLPIVDTSGMAVLDLTMLIDDIHRLHQTLEDLAGRYPFVLPATPFAVATPLAQVLDVMSAWCASQRQANITALERARPSEWTDKIERFMCLLEWNAGSDDERFFELVEEYRAFRAA